MVRFGTVLAFKVLFALGVGSCNSQCVESGVFACQLLELVCFVIWGRGQISGLM